MKINLPLESDRELAETACPAPGTSTACSGRREFLTRSVAGGLAIALGGALVAGTARADDDDEKAEKGEEDEKAMPKAATPIDAAKDGDLVIKPSDYPELQKVGGFVTLDTKAGKIVVARVDETKFVAVGAVCTHKGGPVLYDAAKADFYCPWHGSRFALDGTVTKKPAKAPLPSYAGEPATVFKVNAR